MARPDYAEMDAVGLLKKCYLERSEGSHHYVEVEMPVSQRFFAGAQNNSLEFFSTPLSPLSPHLIHPVIYVHSLNNIDIKQFAL